MSPRVNRLISTNLAGVRPDRLPPPRREGPVRALFIHGNILGFVNVASGPLVRSSYHADRQAAGHAVR